jgi:hypothetical protein
MRRLPNTGGLQLKSDSGVHRHPALQQCANRGLAWPHSLWSVRRATSSPTASVRVLRVGGSGPTRSVPHREVQRSTPPKVNLLKWSRAECTSPRTCAPRGSRAITRYRFSLDKYSRPSKTKLNCTTNAQSLFIARTK